MSYSFALDQDLNVRVLHTSVMPFYADVEQRLHEALLEKLCDRGRVEPGEALLSHPYPGAPWQTVTYYFPDRR